MEQISQVTEYSDLLERPNFRSELAFDKDSGRRFGSVVLPYHFSEDAPCGIASCRTPHRMGYLITTSDQLETAIGGHCGKKFFGVSFTRERKRIDQAIADQRRVETVMTMIGNMQQMLIVVEQLERDYKHLHGLKERLIGAIGHQVYTALKTRAERGSPVINRSVPMTQAEAEIVFETTNRHRNDGLGWPHKEIPICTLEGLDFIKARFKDMLVTNLILPMRELSKVKPEDVKAMSKKTLSSTAKWVGEVPQGIIQAGAVIAAGKRFFTSANISNLTHVGADSRSLSSMVEDLLGAEKRSAG